VVLGSESYMAPVDRVKEVGGGNDDINADFGGNYVWLVPEYTVDKNKALTNIKFVLADKQNSAYGDLASGAGGKYRYLIPEVDTSNPKKISKLVLWRYPDSNLSTSGITSKGRTSDLNAERKKTYLYLGWDYFKQ
ncbi:hypothetical protein K435DRAFT_670398, partial [Dendrothele bispora CBS 962.96]